MEQHEKKQKAKKTAKKVLRYLGDVIVPILLAGIFKVRNRGRK